MKPARTMSSVKHRQLGTTSTGCLSEKGDAPGVSRGGEKVEYEGDRV